MKRKILMSIISLGIVTGSFAREMRSPLSLRSGVQLGYMHYPILRPKADDTCWNFDVWGAGEARLAPDAFHKDDNGSTTKKESLAGIWFGRTEFTLADAFAPGTIQLGNPFFNIATFRPTFDYEESIAMFGLNIERAFCCGAWRVGLKSAMPFRAMKVSLDSCCDLIQGGRLCDVCRMKREQVPTDVSEPETVVISNSYAYRLDFLAALLQQINDPTSNFVVFANPMVFDRITMAQNIDVTDVNGSPIHVIKRLDGTAPQPPMPCAAGQETVSSTAGVAADGGNGANNERLRFLGSTNYTPLGNNQANQRTLWVVPTMLANGDSLLPAANTIQDRINSIVQSVSECDLTDLLSSNSVTFNTQRQTGAGDLDVYLYAQRDWCACDCQYGFFQGMVGVRFPTAKRQKDPLKLLALQPLGNNRHWEVKVGAELGWEPTDWLAMKIDGLYSHAFRRTERVAAPFQGATVKNIGPLIDGRISWDYFIGNVDFTFLSPCNACGVGFDVGYQIYVKGKDRIKFDQETAVDFLGNVQPLDADVLRNRTDVIAHKVKTEMFVQGEYWQIFGGWTHVFAGKNAMRESDWHLGFYIYF